MYPNSDAVAMIFTMLRPSTATFLPYLCAELMICCTRSTFDANVAMIIRPFKCSANRLSRRFPTFFSDGV